MGLSGKSRAYAAGVASLRGRLAQLDRALVSEAEGHAFESRTAR